MSRPSASWAQIGPGLVLAATGVGAGDLVAAAVAGSRFGYAVIWAAFVGAALKFALNEGLARWQLASGTTLLEGWGQRLGRGFCIPFLLYLVIWSFVVAGALIAATGLAAHAMVPALSVEAWGVLHSLVAALLVVLGGYARFERLIKIFIGVMVVALVGCASWITPPPTLVRRTFLDAGIPDGGVPFVVGLIGGVGGSVTLLAYGYWIRERGWRGAERLPMVRLDLAVAYGLTALFGAAVVVLAAEVLAPTGTSVEGSSGVMRMATMLEPTLGQVGRWTFLVGFWSAVTTSMLGVWQGVPYLFCDTLRAARLVEEGRPVEPRAPLYRAYVLFLAVPPLTLLVFGKPVALIIAYSVTGALFMPWLAGSLLVLGGRSGGLPPAFRNGVWSRVALVTCLVLFGWLGVTQLLHLMR